MQKWQEFILSTRSAPLLWHLCRLADLRSEKASQLLAELRVAGSKITPALPGDVVDEFLEGPPVLNAWFIVEPFE